MKRAAIFGAAPCADMSFTRRYTFENTLIVCADGGIKNARAAGFSPDILIGDADSGGEPGSGYKTISLKEEKDVTDLHACIDYVLSSGIRDILIFGCLGGRADHNMANIYLLEYISENGAEGLIADSDNEIFFMRPGMITLENKKDFKYISILPADRELKGVTLTGMKYPLSGAVVVRGTTIGVSNEPVSDKVRIEIKSGGAFIIKSQRLQ